MAKAISQLPETETVMANDILPIVTNGVTSKVKYSIIKQNILNEMPEPTVSVTWNDVVNKPFNYIGTGLSVSGGVLNAIGGIDFSQLSNMLVEGNNISITSNSDLQTITFSATVGIDDNSTTDTNVTWSAYKLNTILGDINAILASVVGGDV